MKLRLRAVMLTIALALPAGAAAQIADSYREVANRIIAAAQTDSSAFHRLAELTDTFGPRLSGSRNLEDAIDWILTQMTADGLDNVHGEAVIVPHWVRGKESARLLSPRNQPLNILGLGRSVGTPWRGIKAEVLVVGSFEELDARSTEAAGKIVLYNVPFTTYGETVQYRSRGAVEAAKHGALAVLVRSVTPHSLNTPHTGAMSNYPDDGIKIPAAAVTVEDAMMMQRMADRGETLVVRLKMGAKTLPDASSRNVVAEITGSEFPDEVIVMGGHIDSWDVGTGAMDDAGGCVAAWEALNLLKELGLRPRRTVRVVMWTNEEKGLEGG
ncbi:MAG: M20/M25/M40 family metallo-hydrolase, partial [Candidatus Marinimicrobia bacterium]|nr:M20/M25/M40 family metallo-hydrolase [Candidatus Neomarinimicrobiota bacterium]